MKSETQKTVDRVTKLINTMTPTQATHTPGDWIAHGTNVNHEAQGVEYLIATCATSPLDKPEREANARLIAAAPELRTALIVLIDHAQEQHPHFESERGQREINNAIKAIEKCGTVWKDIILNPDGTKSPA